VIFQFIKIQKKGFGLNEYSKKKKRKLMNKIFPDFAWTNSQTIKMFFFHIFRESFGII